MNKKGEIGVGTILLIAIAIIAALALYQSISQQVGEKITTVRVNNQTVTAGAANVSVELQGQNIVSGASSSVTLNANNTNCATNVTIAQGLGSDGLTATLMTTKAGGVGVCGGKSVNVTYTYEPDGYMSDAGSRTIFELITIFAAIAVAVIALSPAAREAIGLSGG